MSYFSQPTLPFWKVEEWLRDYAMKWWAEYEANFARAWSVPAEERLPTPLHWETSTEFVQWSENALPHVVIISPGLSDTGPFRHGDGQVDACLLMTFVHLAGAGGRGSSRKLALSYSAITRQMIEQSGNAERSEISGIRYVDEDNGTNVPTNDSVASAAVTFEVDVVGIMNIYGGPPFPDPRPDPNPDPGSRPVVTDENINIDVVKEIP